jgi:hypothetical protein
MSPVRGHLSAAGCRIFGGAHGLLQHFVGSDAQRKAQRAVAIVEVQPVVALAQGHSGSDLHGLVAGAANLEEDPVLPLERDFPIVQPASSVHEAKRPNQIFLLKPLKASHG